MKRLRELEIGWENEGGDHDASWPVCSRFDCSWNEELCNHASLSRETVLNDPKNPPCCIQLQRDMLFEFDSFLRKHKIPYFIHYGTLLGAIRNNSLLPWTADVDIALENDDWKKIIETKELKEELWDLGYNGFYNEPAKMMGRVCFNRIYKGGVLHTTFPSNKKSGYYHHYPYVDIYTIRPRGENGIATYRGPCTYDIEDIYPFGYNHTIKLLGKDILVPNVPENVLAIAYGDTWRTPMRSRHSKGCGDGGYKKAQKQEKKK